jgi:hypothetical protein
MNKKKIILISIFLMVFTLANARVKKRNQLQKLDGIELINSTFMHKSGGIIYQFEIKTKVENITIDSVWFGGAPVPCDLYKTLGDFRIEQTNEKGTYYVKANKNLYRIFPQKFDSTNALKSLKSLKVKRNGSVAVIMYKLNGRRAYFRIGEATEVEVQTRE